MVSYFFLFPFQNYNVEAIEVSTITFIYMIHKYQRGRILITEPVFVQWFVNMEMAFDTR